MTVGALCAGCGSDTIHQKGHCPKNVTIHIFTRDDGCVWHDNAGPMMVNGVAVPTALWVSAPPRPPDSDLDDAEVNESESKITWRDAMGCMAGTTRERAEDIIRRIRGGDV